MRKPWHPAVEWLYVPLCLVVFFVALPVAFPVAMIQHGLTERRKRRCVERTRCGRCGALLGQAALARSDAELRAQFERMNREYPGMRRRFVRRVHAVCVACRQGYGYDEKADAFVPQEAD